MFSIVLGKYLERNCWVMATLFLTFWATARLFSKAAAPYDISTRAFQFPTSSTTLVIAHPLDHSHPGWLWQNFYNKK